MLTEIQVRARRDRILSEFQEYVEKLKREQPWELNDPGFERWQELVTVAIEGLTWVLGETEETLSALWHYFWE